MRSKYVRAVQIARLELEKAEAELAYFDYLVNEVDLFEEAARILVTGLFLPSGLEGKEREGCRAHILKIKILESELCSRIS